MVTSWSLLAHSFFSLVPWWTLLCQDCACGMQWSPEFEDSKNIEKYVKHMINYDHICFIVFLLNWILSTHIDDRSNVLNSSNTSRIGPGNRIANPLVFLLPVPAQLSDTTRLCACECHFRWSRYKTRFAPLSWLAKDQGNPNHTSNSLHISAHPCHITFLLSLLCVVLPGLFVPPVGLRFASKCSARRDLQALISRKRDQGSGQK